MAKCNFNKVAKQLYGNRTSAWVFSCKFAVYFQNTFTQEHLWMASSVITFLTQAGLYQYPIKTLLFSA